MKNKIVFSGGCHWCMEAVFQSLNHVEKVEQSYVSERDDNDSFSEAIIIHFEDENISLKVLIDIYMHIICTNGEHDSKRTKNESNVYFFSLAQFAEIRKSISELQDHFKDNLTTRVYPFQEFKPSKNELLEHCFSKGEKPLCEKVIDLKVMLKNQSFSTYANSNKLKQLMDTNL